MLWSDIPPIASGRESSPEITAPEHLPHQDHGRAGPELTELRNPERRVRCGETCNRGRVLDKLSIGLGLYSERSR